MKIKTVRIQNLRSFKDVTLPFDDYTCLVGPNGSGKSTAILALNVFFRETFGPQTDCCNLHEEDFFCRNTKEPIKITVTFGDLSAKEQSELKDYYRQNVLVVSAVATWSVNTRTATVKQFGERMSHPAFNPYYNAVRLEASAPDLKKVFAELRGKNPGIAAATTKADMLAALEAYASEHIAECEPLPSEDQFYGFQGASKLSPFLQWVYIPAVKDALTENVESRNTALGKLLARTARRSINFERDAKELRDRTQEEYKKLLVANQDPLAALSKKLTTRIRDWAHPEAALSLEWRNDPMKSVSISDPVAEILAAEGELFKGSLSRFGHGFQRSYLLALLQELSEGTEGNEPRLILGCEEPELYQHPPQARHLATVFETLSKTNSQVVVCTHSPHFVSAREFESVRIVRKDRKTGTATVVRSTLTEIDTDVSKAYGEKPASAEQGIKAKIFSSLQTELNEMFFSQVAVFVEGPEDRAYLSTYLHLMDLWEEFRKRGCHFVPVNGKSRMVRPVAIARRLGIPTFVMFDTDAAKWTEPRHNEKRKKHEKDNVAILSVCGHTGEKPFPDGHLYKNDLVAWRTEIGAVFKEDISTAEHATLFDTVNAEYGHVGDMDKNELAIADLVSHAWDADKKSKSIMQACEAIIRFSRSV